MSVLTQTQQDQFWRDGVLIVDSAVTPAQLTALRGQFADWVAHALAGVSQGSLVFQPTAGGLMGTDLMPAERGCRGESCRATQVETLANGYLFCYSQASAV